ncbi:MAG TPA: hypothetical protein ENN41_04505, partial [Sediminispirochaeta sp.]|nr:hypothetical protein [Sediminispirochaeta sp.]
MKRISIALTLLLAIGLVGTFAIDFEPVVDFSASAETTFGVDLNDDVTTGFSIDAEADVSVMFVDTTVEKGEGDVYGWIKIEDIALGLAADEATDTEALETDANTTDASGILTAEIGDINARVIFDPMYVQISTAPEFDYDNAEALRLDLADDNDPLPTIGTNDLAGGANAGIIVGADGLGGMIDVAFKLGSVDTYEKDVAAAEFGNTENDYIMGLDLTVMPMDGLTVDAGVVFSTVTDAGMGFTLNPVFAMDMLEAGVPADVYV